MTEEELQELEKAVIEARNHLIELNDAYNEILTKEHEEQAKKNKFSRNNSSLSDLFGDLGIDVETKPKSEKETLLQKEESKYWLRMAFLFFIAMISSWFILPAAILAFVNAIYTAKKKNKIKKEYESKADNKDKNEEKKTVSEKDVLYEKVCEARKAYHDLRKEYENKKLNTEIRKNGENIAVGSQGNGMDPQLYQLYSDYIDYVRNILANSENNARSNSNKTYGLSPEKL